MAAQWIEIAEAISDYSRYYPVPYTLPANLKLASAAAAELHRVQQVMASAVDPSGSDY